MPRDDGLLPNEEPLPPPEESVIVKDEQFTRVPTDDRAILTRCVTQLAIDFKQALDEDTERYDRYARRATLLNRIRDQTRKKTKVLEEFPIKLPIAASSWNDVNVYEIEYRIIQAINDQVDHRHVWYHVRIAFDDFINSQTKEYLEKLDRGESLEFEGDPPQPGPSSSRGNRSRDTPAASSASSPQPSTSQGTTSSSSRRRRAPAPAPVVTLNEDDDDDDCVVID